MKIVVLFVMGLLLCHVAWAAQSVTLVKDGKAQCAIYVPAAIMAPDVERLRNAYLDPQYQPELDRVRLRESVNDLAVYLGKISGAKVPVYTRKPAAADRGVAILVGDFAKGVFGLPKKSSPYKQGWRLVVTPKAVGLLGESPEATSYAIYEVLDRLGCRWYLPSDMGEVVPSLKTISLPVEDTSSVPPVVSRAIWYSDEAYKRRNRLGGVYLDSGHALEIRGYVAKELLEAHPDWNAEINGTRSINGRFCWGNPEVAAAVGDGIIAQLDQHYVDTISLSPDDGGQFCACAKCKALDAGDWDTSMNCVSITDRYIHFCNQVAERVTKKYPHVLFGIIAYVQYTRPPVREKLHPNIVPVLAPITYCRPHVMTDTTCPSRSQLLKFVEGWGKASRGHFGLYEYAYNLAEVLAPNPMITKWSTELPIFYKNHLDIWTPETMANFDTVLPGLYMGIRLSWDPTRKPRAILDEFYTKFYGAAAGPMRRYWETFDAAWSKTPEHAGGGYGYGRIFTEKVMRDARGAINDALRACRTPIEQQRVKMADDSLSVFEGYLHLRHRLFAGDFASGEPGAGATSSRWPLNEEYKIWYGYAVSKAQDYQAQFAFAPRVSDWYVWGPHYTEGYWGASYRDAARIAADYTPISPTINKWRYQADNEQTGEQAGWQAPGYDDTAWKTTDVSTDTWSDLGLADYFGTVWYRTAVIIPAIPAGKQVYLWVSNFDTACKLYVNGQLVPYVDEKGAAQPECSMYCTPFSYNVTAAIKPDAENLITIIGTRAFLNELGVGGLQGPVMLYRDN